ncbi:family 16 glycosylhydrolase [Sphingomonas adhaesiva]|uniref:family 16 glycosylhydrolase n=1 Tax=Sphingomonas adhaesiva TaxID=28212 RepID=UPI002FF6C653
MGTSGSDNLIGTVGNDAFRSLGGGDTLTGGKGDDTYYLSSSNDVVVEKSGEGIDTVYAEQKYVLGAHVENLVLSSQTAWYGGGNDLDNIMTAKFDNQQLDGGKGNDVLVSEAKYTTFIVGKGNGSDVIYGFDSTDKIRLDGYGFSSFDAVRKVASQVGSDTVLSLGGGETLTLRDTKVASLAAANFVTTKDMSGLKATFSDEFDALSLYNKGGTWRTEYGHGGAGSLASRTNNDEIQIYMDADYAGTGKKALGVNPFSIDNGILTITAAPTTEAAKAALGGAQYTSGLLTTKFSFTQQYGYFEIKAQMPEQKGFWPAFWLLPNDNSWPPELDVFEQLSKDPTTLFMSNHGVDANGKHVTTSDKINVDTTQWHTYGVDWGPDKLTYYIDGIAVATQDTPLAMKGKDMYMLVNLAVGGAWGGNPDAGTVEEMKVDYVRAFATENTLSSTVNGVKTVYTPGSSAPSVTPTTTTPVTTTPTTTTPVTTTPTTTTPVTTTPTTTTPVTTPVVTTPTTTVSTPTPSAPVTPVSKLTGTAAVDFLTAKADNSELYGLGGDDVLRGGSYAVKMYGGAGNDTYYVTSASQIVVENANEGTDKVVSTISYTLGANLETLVLDGSANINGTGNNLGNKLIGNTGDNVLTGGTGADWLDGGAGGRDTLIGGAGNDTYIVNRAGTILIEKAGEGYDSVRSTISWTLGDNFEALALDGNANIDATGNALDNRLVGNAGNNVISGGAGNDVLDGGSGGLDVLIGGTGNDLYIVTRTNILLVEKAGEGTDSVQSTVSWTLGDNFENLSLAGTANINGTGNALDNRIMGNAGNNVITGGAGNDTLIGGGGTDTFVFGRNFGKDIITDYNTNDVLQFSGFSKAAMKIVQSGANTVIDFGGADTITLWNTQASDVQAHGHFIF